MKSEWKRCTIEDIASISAGGDKPRVCSNVRTAETPFPVFSNGLENCGLYGYTNKAKIEGDTITISARGVNVGTVCYRKEPFLPIVRLLSLIPDRKIVNARYLYYLLRNTPLSGTGSAQPQITVPMIKKQEICIHNDIETQKSIAGILSCLDDKIALNTAINENLEEQAQAICEKWVSDHSQSIVLRPLAEIADINPDTYSPKEKWNHVNYLDTSSITNGVISEIQSISPDKEKLPSRARRKIIPNDIVYSTVRPNQLHFGIVSNPLSNMLASTGFAVIRSRYSHICSPFIYQFLTSPSFIEKMQQLAEQSTSTFPCVKPSDIGACLIPCTDELEMCKISDLCNGIYAIKSAIYQENQHLATLRDTLLPKLMNGEIDVSKIKI